MIAPIPGMTIPASKPPSVAPRTPLRAEAIEVVTAVPMVVLAASDPTILPSTEPNCPCQPVFNRLARSPPPTAAPPLKKLAPFGNNPGLPTPDGPNVRFPLGTVFPDAVGKLEN